MELVRETSTLSTVFILSALCLIMERSPFDYLFGNNATDAEVVDEAPLVPEIPFKIPMNKFERIMNNRY